MQLVTEFFEGGIVILVDQLSEHFELLSVELGGSLGGADFRGKAASFPGLLEQLLNEAGSYSKLLGKLSL